MKDDLIDRVRLVRSPGIGPITYRQLIARFGDAAAALAAVPGGVRRTCLVAAMPSGRSSRSRVWARVIWCSGRGCTRACSPRWTTRRRF